MILVSWSLSSHKRFAMAIGNLGYEWKSHPCYFGHPFFGTFEIEGYQQSSKHDGLQIPPLPRPRSEFFLVVFFWIFFWLFWLNVVLE